MAVDDEHLVAVEHPAVALLGGGELNAREVPLPVVLRDGQRPDRLPRGDAGQVGLLGLVVARREQRVRRQGHRREERGAQQRGAHLLQDHQQLHVREARAAELLGDGQGLQAQLVGHLAPHGGVVAVLGVHQPPYLGLGRLLRQEPAHGRAQLLLLVTESEIHARAPLVLPVLPCLCRRLPHIGPAVRRTSVSTRRKSGGTRCATLGRWDSWSRSGATRPPRSTRSSWARWTTTCTSCVAAAPVTPCSSMRPTSTRNCSRSAGSSA